MTRFWLIRFGQQYLDNRTKVVQVILDTHGTGHLLFLFCVFSVFFARIFVKIYEFTIMIRTVEYARTCVKLYQYSLAIRTIWNQ